LLFLLQCERPRDLHSFPPRRSSDLESGRCSDPRWRIEHPLKGKLDVASREGLAVVKLDTFPELKLPLQVAELGPRDCKSRHQLEVLRLHDQGVVDLPPIGMDNRPTLHDRDRKALFGMV